MAGRILLYAVKTKRAEFGDYLLTRQKNHFNLSTGDHIGK
jgi:hypothetical protein